MVLAYLYYVMDRDKMIVYMGGGVGLINIIIMCRIAVSLNLIYSGLNYISATIGTAMVNIIPPAVFTMAVCLRLINIIEISV